VPASFYIVVSCVNTGLATGRLLVQGVLPNVETGSKRQQKYSPERPKLKVGYSAYVVVVVGSRMNSVFHVLISQST
jgi:hypothetical protein